MKLHKEGYTILSVSGILFLALCVFANWYFGGDSFIFYATLTISLVFYILFLQFFRYPNRELTIGEKFVVAPCDGKVVVIEEVFEPEFYKEKRLQLSIFMSPINVHANWYPVSGRVSYVRYHVGKYLVAWHPKASTENERSTIVIEKDNKSSILIRQIAGALAKRIVYYPHEDDKIRQCGELGFIKFGSRVDVYMPLGIKVNVKIGDKTKGGVTVLAEM